MKNYELVELLHKLPTNAEVLAWDPDTNKFQEVTGAVYEESQISLFTDK